MLKSTACFFLLSTTVNQYLSQPLSNLAHHVLTDIGTRYKIWMTIFLRFMVESSPRHRNRCPEDFGVIIQFLKNSCGVCEQ